MNQIKAIFLSILSAYMLFVSCGFTVSHIYCQKGERWIIGEEMPPCKYPGDSEICSESAKNEHPPRDQKDDQRQKDTYNFRFEFVGNQLAYAQDEVIPLWDEVIGVSHAYEVDSAHGTYDKKNLLRSHFFLDLLKPDRAKLQVFRI